MITAIAVGLGCRGDILAAELADAAPNQSALRQRSIAGGRHMSSFALLASSSSSGRVGVPLEAPIDRVYLARFTMGNEALEQEVLELFAAQAPLYLQRLREAETVADWKEALHTLKGSAAAVGAQHVARLAEVMERLAASGTPKDQKAHRDKALGALIEATEAACRHIAQLFQT
jgi:HPt (histidine-containing phosphotransfer) domain-containing protein